MPMDYDDSNSQAHILRVTSEEKEKSQATSCPFPLPRFDFDEQLQAHLRFDNLIESEVYFGIQGPDCNWIEGFSAGNTNIEFSSGAADSCSLSRTNNVWSEATSTESVEMLLKSVGENEMAHQVTRMNDDVHEQLVNMDQLIDTFQDETKTCNSWTRHVDGEIINDQSHTSPSSAAEEDAKANLPVDNLLSCALDMQVDKDVVVNSLDGNVDSEKASIADNFAPGSAGDGLKNEGSDGYYNIVNSEHTVVKFDSETSQVIGEPGADKVFSFDSVTRGSGIDQLPATSFVGADIIPGTLESSFLSHNSMENCKPSENYSCTTEHEKQNDPRNITSADCMAIQLSRGVTSGSDEGSLIVKSTTVAVNLLSETSNPMLSPKTSDGMLEAIAYQVKSPTDKEGSSEANACVEQTLFDGERFTMVVDISIGGDASAFNSSSSNDPTTDIACCHAGSLAISGSVSDNSKQLLGGNGNIVDIDPLKVLDIPFGASTTTICGDVCDKNFTCQDVDRASEGGDVCEAAEGGSATDMSLAHNTDNISPKQSSLPRSHMEMEVTMNSDLNPSSADNVNSTEADSGDPHLISPMASSHVDKAASSPNLTDLSTSCDQLDTGEDCSMSMPALVGISSQIITDLPTKRQDQNSDLVAPSENGCAFEMKGVDISCNVLNNDVYNPPVEDQQLQDAFSLLPASSGLNGVSTHSEDPIELLEQSSQDVGGTTAACCSPVVPSSTELCEQDKEPKHILPENPSALSVNQGCGEVCLPITSGTEKSSENTNVGHGDSISISVNVSETEKAFEKDVHIEGKSFAAMEDSEPDRDPLAAAQNIYQDTAVRSLVSDGKVIHSATKGASAEAANQAAEEQCTIVAAETISSKKKKRQGGKNASSSSMSANTKSKEIQEEAQPSSMQCSSNIFCPTFTDGQHVQLRAQIFVYGALIQGIPPREEFMISAFGEHDGGRAAWEVLLRSALERFKNQSSSFGSILETPTGSRLGFWATEEVSKKSSVAKQKPTGRPSSKHARSPNLALPFGLSKVQSGTQLDFHQFGSPLFPYISSQAKQPIGSAAAYASQSASPASWLASPKSVTFDPSAQLPATPAAGAAKLSSARNLAVSTSPVQIVSPTTLLPNKESQVTYSAVAVLDKQKEPANNHSSISQKQRKRRKSLESGGQSVDQISEHKIEPASDSLYSKHPTVPLGFTMLSISPAGVACSGAVLSTSEIVSTTSTQRAVVESNEQRGPDLEVGGGHIERAKLSSDDAATHASEAVKHSEDTWMLLARNSKIGLPSEVEEKLTSAAAASAAAASVAKAAAEAAKVASEAALQAKFMAEEAIFSVKLADVGEPGCVKVDANGSSKGTTGNDNSHGSNSFLSVARELARRRAEAASAAAKRAENLDAIMKAAEQAAEAVSQAGAIIAMGDPLPFTLSELLLAGPEGYWKSDRLNTSKSVIETDVPIMNSMEEANRNDKLGPLASSNHIICEGQKLIEEPSFSDKAVQLSMGQPVVTTSTSRADVIPMAASVKLHCFQRGSLVEVAADKGVWYSAKVIDVEEDRMRVCYSDRRDDEGVDYLKEWIPLEYETGKVPRVRIAHPSTSAKFEGTRKRRRDSAATCNWAVGDHVDAWIKDSWWDGIVAEKCEGNEAKYTVNFPDQGKSFVVDAWNLRASLVWRDGRWTQWSHGAERTSHSLKGDSPFEKRRKVGVLDETVSGVGNLDQNKESSTLLKPGEAKLLNLSKSDVMFAVGRGTTDSQSDAAVSKQTGLLSGVSRVVIGVPKPGKKRKFMEVSKHYITEKAGRAADGSALVKPYSSSLTSGQRENMSKGDTKVRRINEAKPRGPKPMRSQEISVGSSSEIEPSSTAVSSDGLAHFLPSLGNSNVRRDNRDTGYKRNIASKTSESSKRSDSKTSDGSERALSDGIEPRRSNRRIQPTSRLLEGLQSSLIMSRASNERGSKGYQRSTLSAKGRERG